MSDDLTRKRLEKCTQPARAFAFKLLSADCVVAIRNQRWNRHHPHDERSGRRGHDAGRDAQVRARVARRGRSTECPRCNIDLPCKQHPPSAVDQGDPCAFDGCGQQATASAISDHSRVAACAAHVDQIAQALDDPQVLIVRGLRVLPPPRLICYLPSDELARPNLALSRQRQAPDTAGLDFRYSQWEPLLPPDVWTWPALTAANMTHEAALFQQTARLCDTLFRDDHLAGLIQTRLLAARGLPFFPRPRWHGLRGRRAVPRLADDVPQVHAARSDLLDAVHGVLHRAERLGHGHAGAAAWVWHPATAITTRPGRSGGSTRARASVELTGRTRPATASGCCSRRGSTSGRGWPESSGRSVFCFDPPGLPA